MAGGAWEEARMMVTGRPASDTVTQQLVGLGVARGERPALVGGCAAWPGRTLSHASLSAVLQAAAAGLVRHGVREQDIVGICVPDAVSYVLAVHAVRAAGGVPSPVPGAGPPDVMASQLTDCGARLLITADPLASAALAAADGSWVRQVISFDDVPGTTAFCSLLSRGSRAPAVAGPADLALAPYRAGPDGLLRLAPVTHRELGADLNRLAARVPIGDRDVVLAEPPGGHARDYTVLLDLALLHGATVVATQPEGLPDAARAHGGTAAIVHPGTDVPAGLPLRMVTAAG
ncbi:MAG TPA: AMP-binding protein [Streptosporangiaceae bacterium]|nr:AMP-binding protein [Streptosporangiaceae bacterium]